MARRVNRIGVVEDFVEQVVDTAIGHHESPAHVEPERVGGGRSVERRRHPRSPVDHDGLAAFVLDVTAADVPRRPGHLRRAFLVDPSEGEAGDVDVECSQALLQMPSCDLTVDGLRGHVVDRHRGFGALSHGRQTSVGVIEMALLSLEVWVGHCCSFLCGNARKRPADPTMGGLRRVQNPTYASRQVCRRDFG